ncbi:MAG TPA: hypothetical protein VJ892_01750 [Candidatus Absconditabacterales bacterium]|nr:hypothetical protein [Candidatus Absconditabacterales bacterium]
MGVQRIILKLDPENKELKNKFIDNINKFVEHDEKRDSFDVYDALYIEKALELDPNNEEFREKAIESWEKKAKESIINRDLREASNMYKRALELDPNNERIKEKLIKNHLNKAYEYLVFENSIGGAIDEFEEALRLDSNNEEIEKKLRELIEKM